MILPPEDKKQRREANRGCMAPMDVDSQELIKRVAERLEKIEQIKPPEWSLFVKTGVSRERPPAQKNWWSVRSASILRALDTKGAMGTSELRRKYGGRKRRGHKPEHKYKASGAVIRKILQQLEAAGLAKKQNKKGRRITRKGQSLLDSVAKSMRGDTEPKQPAVKA